MPSVPPRVGANPTTWGNRQTGNPQLRSYRPNPQLLSKSFKGFHVDMASSGNTSHLNVSLRKAVELCSQPRHFMGSDLTCGYLGAYFHHTPVINFQGSSDHFLAHLGKSF
jgi:hypothetical protein